MSDFSKEWGDDDVSTVVPEDDDEFWKWYHKVCAEAYRQYKLDKLISDEIRREQELAQRRAELDWLAQE